MKAKASDWYKKIWSLDIKYMSWTENTAAEVDRITEICSLKGGERILDLACGFGRHSLEFARRGFSVVGVDITEDYIKDARSTAQAEGLSDAEFICADIRDTAFENEFDLVLNLADGAIGYLENDTENLKIFDAVSKALRQGGQHICDIVNGSYAAAHFPVRLWESGEKQLSLSEFDFDPKTGIMLYGSAEIPYGQPLVRPDISEGDPTRVYTYDEIRAIMLSRGMRTVAAYAGYQPRPVGINDFQMLVHSIKTKA